MNDNIEKHIEELVDKMMKDSKLESPSMDFKANIMGKVHASSTNEITTYRPLISKQFFIVAIVFIVAISVFVISMSSTNTNNWFSIINFQLFSNNELIEALSNIKISKTVLYSIVFFGLMLFIQIPILKNHFNKRLKV